MRTRTPVLFVHGMGGNPQEFRALIESRVIPASHVGILEDASLLAAMRAEVAAHCAAPR